MTIIKLTTRSALQKALACLPLLALCGPSLAQETLSVQTGSKLVTISRGNAPVLDGRLDEADWESATLIDDFHQIVPVEYAEPSEPMRIRIYYNDDALYIGARLVDSQP